MNGDKRQDIVVDKKLNAVADKSVNTDKKQDTATGKKSNTVVESSIPIKD